MGNSAGGEGEIDRPTGVARPWLEEVLDTVRRLGGLRDLTSVLDGVVDAVHTVGGFGAAAVNVVRPDGDVEVVAVSPAARDLLGQRASIEVWTELLAGANQWRGLRYYRHDQDQTLVEQLVTWDPAPRSDVSAPTADRDPAGSAWHPEDLLLAPMWAEDGTLVGVLSVDEPRSGCFPDDEHLTVLELLAAQVGRAIVDAGHQAVRDDRDVLYTAAFDGAAGPMVIVDGDLDLIGVNGAARRLFALVETARLGAALVSLVDPADADAVVAACRDVAAAEGRPRSIDARLAGPDGGSVWVRARIARVDSAIVAPRLVIDLADITEQRRTLAELEYQAGHDALTGLPNRRSVDAHLDAALRTLRPGQAIAVLACDVDRFKAVNDDHGHGVGDELLVQVARRLEGAVRPGDLLARMGGDELVVVAVIAGLGADGHGVARAIAQRCVDAIRVPMVIGSVTCAVTLSVGLAVGLAGEDLTAADLVDRADRALYRAKSAGRDRWQATD